MENFLCVLAVDLHDNSVLGDWKCELLNTGLKVQVIENKGIKVSV